MKVARDCDSDRSSGEADNALEVLFFTRSQDVDIQLRSELCYAERHVMPNVLMDSSSGWILTPAVGKYDIWALRCN